MWLSQGALLSYLGLAGVTGGDRLAGGLGWGLSQPLPPSMWSLVLVAAHSGASYMGSQDSLRARRELQAS